MIKQLNKSTVETVGRPVRILQFGEGNFLRAFVDWQIDIANEKGVMDAGVAVCQPIIDPERKVLGMIDLMHRQDNMYHVYLEGIENKRPKKDVRLVKSIMDSFNPYVDYAKYEAYFLSPELKITISNTTEAGIRYEEGDDLTACPPKSYPAKMTALLYKRFKHFNGDPTKGLCIICCELIENNGSTLHEYVIRHAEYHKLGQDFIDWVENSCHFCDTLASDRISFNTEAGKTYTITAIPDNTLAAAPTGLKVTKIKDGETVLTWDAVKARTEVSYNVYRQIEGGEWVQVQTELKATEWTDTDAWDVLGTLKYKVTAVIDGKESEFSSEATVDDCRNMIGMIDDQDERIKYTGSWGNWISQEGNYGGSVKYLEDPTGTETAELTFCGTGIEVFSCTQNDRGKVEISIDGEVWATADTYSATQKRQAKIFSTEEHKDKTLEYGIHTVKVRAMGEKNASAKLFSYRLFYIFNKILTNISNAAVVINHT